MANVKEFLLGIDGKASVEYDNATVKTVDLAAAVVINRDTGTISDPTAIAALQAVPGLGGAGALIVNDPSAARTNTEIIEAALADGLCNVIADGIVWANPIHQPSRSKLYISPRARLKRASGSNAPLIRNTHCGHVTAGTKLVRADNVVTVSERFHGKSSGSFVYIGNATDAAMNGIHQIVATPSEHSWTFANAGANGNGGGASQYVSIIPLKRAIAGASFVRTDNVVVVNDPGHDLQVGQEVFVAATAAATFAGMAEVIAVGTDSWSYLKAGANGSAAGTLHLSYDSDITIDADGPIDGNYAANLSDESAIHNCVVVLGAVTHYSVTGSIGGTNMRAANFQNTAHGDVSFKSFDCLVAAQFEGSAKHVSVHGMRGSNMAHTTRLTDDIVAFTGTRFIGGQSYDNTVSPYGLGLFVDLTVDGVRGHTAINGVKLTFDPLCFVDDIEVRDIHGGWINKTGLPGHGSGVRIVDDTDGLTGMRVGTLVIDGVHWAGGASAVHFQSQGQIESMDLRNLQTPIADGQTSNYGQLVLIYGGDAPTGRIKRLSIEQFTWVAPTDSSPGIILGSGNTETVNTIQVDHLKIGNARCRAGGNYGQGAPVLKYGNARVGHLEIVSATFEAPGTGTGTPVSIVGPSTVGTLTFNDIDVIPNETTSNNMGWSTLLGPSTDNINSSMKIRYINSRLSSLSGISDGGATMNGSLDIAFLGSNWVSAGNNFIQMAATGLAVSVSVDASSSITDGQVVLGSFGGTLRVRGPMKLDGNKVNAPQPGDTFWNTNAAMTGSASVGMKGRTSAGAWASLF